LPVSEELIILIVILSSVVGIFIISATPTELQELETQAPYVHQALKTNEPFIARLQRDILEEVDNHWLK